MGERTGAAYVEACARERDFLLPPPTSQQMGFLSDPLQASGWGSPLADETEEEPVLEASIVLPPVASI